MHYQEVSVFGNAHTSTVLLAYDRSQMIPITYGQSLARCILSIVTIGWFTSTTDDMATSIPMDIVKAHLSSIDQTTPSWLDNFNRAEVIRGNHEHHIAQINLI